MKKLVIIAAMGLMVSVPRTHGDLSWDAPAENIGVYGIQAGWLVAMYHDANSDSDLSTIIFDNTGAVISGTGSSGDVAMGSAYQTLTYHFQPPYDDIIQFNDQIEPGWQTLYGGASVYSVVINSDSWATATQSLVLDASTHTLGATDPHTYVVAIGSNDWQVVIPEPGTAGLILAGLLALRGLRRRFV